MKVLWRMTWKEFCLDLLQALLLMPSLLVIAPPLWVFSVVFLVGMLCRYLPSILMVVLNLWALVLSIANPSSSYSRMFVIFFALYLLGLVAFYAFLQKKLFKENRAAAPAPNNVKEKIDTVQPPRIGLDDALQSASSHIRINISYPWDIPLCRFSLDGSLERLYLENVPLTYSEFKQWGTRRYGYNAPITLIDSAYREYVDDMRPHWILHRVMNYAQFWRLIDTAPDGKQVLEPERKKLFHQYAKPLTSFPEERRSALQLFSDLEPEAHIAETPVSFESFSSWRIFWDDQSSKDRFDDETAYQQYLEFMLPRTVCGIPMTYAEFRNHFLSKDGKTYLLPETALRAKYLENSQLIQNENTPGATNTEG